MTETGEVELSSKIYRPAPHPTNRTYLHSPYKPRCDTTRIVGGATVLARLKAKDKKRAESHALPLCESQELGIPCEG